MEKVIRKKKYPRKRVKEEKNRMKIRKKKMIEKMKMKMRKII